MFFWPILNLALCTSLVVFMTSCSAESDKVNDYSSSEEFSKLNKELQVLEEDFLSKIKELGSKIEAMNGKIEEIEENRFLDCLDLVEQEDFLRFKNKTTDDLTGIKGLIVSSSTIFNLKEKQGFSKINSDGLIFCVSVENVQAYLDGFKVSFKIGNPLFVTFQNPKIHIKWGKDPFKYYGEQKSEGKSISGIFDSWKKSLQEKEITILKDLKPGVWNSFEIVLTSSKLDEIEHVEFSMEVDTLSFYRDTSAS